VAYAARVLLDSLSEAGVRLTTMEVTFPRFVLSEFNTHRVFCLDGDTKLYFDLPCGKNDTRRFTMSLREIYEKWHVGAAPRRNRSKRVRSEAVEPDRLYTAKELASAAGYAGYTGVDLLTRRLGMPRVENPGQPYRVRGSDFLKYARSEGTNRQPMRDRIAAMQLRSCNEESGEIYHTNISDVCYSGKKDVFRVRLANGNEIVSSADHLFMTDNGWQRLADAVDLTLNPSGLATWSKKAKLAVNGTEAYRDPQWLQAQRDAGLSAAAIAAREGVSLDRIKYQFRKHGIANSNPAEVRRVSHTEDPWNKGRRYSNLLTRGRPATGRIRRGAESHWWKGGITPDRKMIGAWTQHNAFGVHRANGFRCVLCGDGRDLHAHHLDPVANNIARARDVTNLTTICGDCHRELHGRNLELVLLDYIETGRTFEEFWGLVGYYRRPRPFVGRGKRTMVRHFQEVVAVEYVGVRDTYDIEVSGPFHNFVADGFIVHNSRNSASSRAIPTAKLIERVMTDPVLPLEWGKNKAGMSASSVLSADESDHGRAVWLAARDAAVSEAKKLLDLQVHKQVLNRILEPFLWHTVIVTSTDWSNFFELRCAPAAQPEIREAAIQMRSALEQSTPTHVKNGDWHLPLVQDDEREAVDIENLKKASVARCARVSYLTHEGTRDIQKDLDLHDRLKIERHLSPFEHVATPAPDADFHANFRGWIQMRASIENGARSLAGVN